MRRLKDAKRRILEAIQKEHGISSRRLMDTVWADDPDGGPEYEATLGFHIWGINKFLAPQGLMIKAMGHKGVGYRIVDIDNPASPPMPPGVPEGVVFAPIQRRIFELVQQRPGIVTERLASIVYPDHPKGGTTIVNNLRANIWHMNKTLKPHGLVVWARGLDGYHIRKLKLAGSKASTARNPEASIRT